MDSLAEPKSFSKNRQRTSLPRAAPREGEEKSRWMTSQKKTFVLCFDGTGNKFSGTESDSNILKIYRMLDRSDGNQYRFYQPGIGTYVTTRSLSHTSKAARLKSWYAKSKDSAIGTSFDAHVMGGYQFLMRYYSYGDEIYMFGFSRGAYTAKFLAEMLDHIGLLSAGNEEMVRFAWKTFQNWQMRQDRTDDEKKKKKALMKFMRDFQETFCRPVRRLRFLGLFDTVNSVPRFESAWMRRSKFPYTVRTRAKVVRHAVSIDERRAKFRQDLISEVKTSHHHHHEPHAHHNHRDQSQGKSTGNGLQVPKTAANGTPSGARSLGPDAAKTGDDDRTSTMTSASETSLAPMEEQQVDSDDEGEQDVQEVWFSGCHADIGGGWPLQEDEEISLSHIPLVWMIRAAQKAGLRFDESKLRAYCYTDDGSQRENNLPIPQIEIEGVDLEKSSDTPPDPEDTYREEFRRKIVLSATRGRIHDVLQFGNGAGAFSVASWNIMEYLPFRRMDLQEDGSWSAIWWPLPKGEVRDMPLNAIIHNSAIKRMEADAAYRPGNLICGGGGRGVRRAPEERGIGKWKVYEGEGDLIEELYVRDE